MDALKKRSQAERLLIAFTLIDSIWWEMQNGKIDSDLLQLAVDTQVDINRIVWLLNKQTSGR